MIRYYKSSNLETNQNNTVCFNSLYLPVEIIKLTDYEAEFFKTCSLKLRSEAFSLKLSENLFVHILHTG